MQIPKDFLKESNLDESRAFVKMSANWFSIATCSMTTVLFSTSSLIKCWRISICLVLECWTGFLDMFIALWCHNKQLKYPEQYHNSQAFVSSITIECNNSL